MLQQIERMQEKCFIQQPLIMLCLEYIEMDLVISELYHKGTILQKNYRKMTISWSLSYNSFVKFIHGKKEFRSHNITVLQ